MTTAAVVGSGPNGLAAAVVLARAGLSVTVYEAADTPGGGARTEELMEPGHWHDTCSAVHPMALASPFFREFELSRRVELAVPDISFAHPLDAGRGAVAYRSLERTCAELGRDGTAYGKLLKPLVERVQGVVGFALNGPARIPVDPLAAARLAAAMLEQGSPLWNRRFRDDAAPALLSGLAAHSVGRLPSPSSAAAGLLLGALAHSVGWPIPIGGSGAITQALISDLQAHGGRLVTGRRIKSLRELDARAVLLDTSPRGLLDLTADGRGGTTLPAAYARRLRRYRFGNAACKVDFILSGPVPWADSRLHAAGTVHLGGRRAELAASEAQVAAGRHPEDPYVLVSQPSGWDPARASAGRHILWTYCHVPAGSDRDMTAAVTARIERFAPGFRDVVVRSLVTTAQGLERRNANYVGGDFASGATDLRQLIARPLLSVNPWKTPLAGVYLCSASTPPGPGVHGMAGFHAARAALRDIFGLAAPSLAPTNSAL